MESAQYPEPPTQSSDPLTSNKVQGYATLNGGTTGGEGGKIVYASTGSEINQALCSRETDDTPLIIYVNGTIKHENTSKSSGSCDTTDSEIQFKGVKNVSLIGVDDLAVFDQIGIHLRNTSNIILQNLHIKNVKKSGIPTSNGGDAIGMETDVFNVWVDHCTLEASGGESQGYDSLLDMKATTQYVTISYTHYRNSGRGGLMGSTDGDNTNTWVSFHHNYYENMDSRLPLLRHGTAHSYNNYYSGIAKSGLNPRAGGRIKVENSYFENAFNPIGTFYTSDMGYWELSNNYFDPNTVAWQQSDSDDWYPAGPDLTSTTSIKIPYDYALDPVACVPALIKATAGAGKEIKVSDGSCGELILIKGNTSETDQNDDNSSNENQTDTNVTSTNLSLVAGSDGSSKVSGTSYANVRDDKLTTYWSPNDSTGRISIKWGTNINVDKVKIVEADGFVGNVTGWELINNTDSTVLASGNLLGEVTFSTIQTKKIDLIITSSKGTAAIAEFAVYMTNNDDSDANSVNSTDIANPDNKTSNDNDQENPIIQLEAIPSSTEVTLNWLSSNIAIAEQKLYRNTSNSFASSNLISETLTSTSYSDSDLIEKDYYYWLVIIDTSGIEHISSSVSVNLENLQTINPTNDACQELISNPNLNWLESTLKSEQDIVACLATSLGKPVGFADQTTGGYDPKGNSSLVIINTSDSLSPEEQILDAISSASYNWIVFDKKDFATETHIAMYKLGCSDPNVLEALDNATEAECRNLDLWCQNHNVPDAQCQDTFFNDKLNDTSLTALKLKMINSNTSIDGRGAKAKFLFNGFKIGADDSGKSTHISENVIITNNYFIGAGHDEDHKLDPDMIRSTGESNNIWIHQNTFETTGDSAFDIKVGAYNISVSFNKLINVKRAALHGSSDSREINSQITSTIHNNLFITNDDMYGDSQFNTLRRVPLMRRGQSHLFNNVFYGYRKDILSVRAGGRILFENNMILNKLNNSKKDNMDYWLESVIRDFRDGGLEITSSYVWASDDKCQKIADAGDLTKSYGSTPNMFALYSKASQELISANKLIPGDNLAKYVMATAGKAGLTPYNSRHANGQAKIITSAPSGCP
ncbi:hypothetical protein XM47_17720 [Catenovulum maritimum]|uniref:Pectate lyase domain-containing protein n=1 Tax=Catenovulum maritimum TaxID=1513271 RepID=A0A0J8GLW3_9ALTE|nr:hypothetical protein XM47_17720 [Catenovulum maritimum]